MSRKSKIIVRFDIKFQRIDSYGVNFGGLRRARIHYLYYRTLSKEDEKWI